MFGTTAAGQITLWTAITPLFVAGSKSVTQTCSSFSDICSERQQTNMNDMARVTNGLPIRRAKKKANILNEKRIKSCIARYDAGVYTRLQFLRAASHSLGAHALQPQSSTSSDNANEAQPPTATVPAPVSAATNVSATTSSPPSVDVPPTSDCCQVCLVTLRCGVALVPCGHAAMRSSVRLAWIRLSTWLSTAVVLSAADALTRCYAFT